MRTDDIEGFNGAAAEFARACRATIAVRRAELDRLESLASIAEAMAAYGPQADAISDAMPNVLRQVEQARDDYRANLATDLSKALEEV